MGACGAGRKKPGATDPPRGGAPQIVPVGTVPKDNILLLHFLQRQCTPAAAVPHFESRNASVAKRYMHRTETDIPSQLVAAITPEPWMGEKPERSSADDRAVGKATVMQTLMSSDVQQPTRRSKYVYAGERVPYCMPPRPPIHGPDAIASQPL